MAQAVSYEVTDGIAVLQMRNPPVNALGAALRRDLAGALARAVQDREVDAIVLSGAGKGFCAGADIAEFEAPFADPWVPELCDLVENAPKPVIAAIHGFALGGGLELALACHFRLAGAEARVGFPEVTLGLLPGAGGTQRAPRLIGAAATLELMITGQPVPVTSDLVRPAFDMILKEGLKAGARLFARKVIDKGMGPRRTRDQRAGFRDPAGDRKALQRWRARLAGKAEKAPGDILRCVEAAALLPFEVGQEFERAAFDDLLGGDQSRALRHIWRAERAAPRFGELARATPRPVAQLGIVGGGSRGAGLAAAGLIAGHEVVLVERDAPALTAALTRVSRVLDRAVRRGRLTQVQRDGIEAVLHGKTDLVALSEADLVIETAGHDARARAAIFAQLDAVVRDGAVLVSGAAYGDVDALAAQTGCAQDVLALHVPLPTLTAPLAEIGVGRHTGAAAVATLHGFVTGLGKRAVWARAGGGLIGSRLMAACTHAADGLVLSGVAPERIDRDMRRWGMGFGPYQMADMLGLARMGDHLEALPGATGVNPHRVLAEAGRAGRHNRVGWYRYDTDTPRGAPDPDAVALLGVGADGAGDPGDIPARLLAAMANEGARLLEAGIARSGGDIDVVMTGGFGLARWRGGPICAADAAGLLALRNRLRGLAEAEGGFWTPAPLLDRLIREGGRLGDVEASAG